MVASIDRIKEQKRALIRRHTHADNVKAFAQVLTALAALALLWWIAVLSLGVSRWLTALAVLLISLFALRIFVLMHECSHGSLFRTQWLNRACGFILGSAAARWPGECNDVPLVPKLQHWGGKLVNSRVSLANFMLDRFLSLRRVNYHFQAHKTRRVVGSALRCRQQ
jgi:hypothetical protein